MRASDSTESSTGSRASRRQFLRQVAATAACTAVPMVSPRTIRAADAPSGRQRTLRLAHLTDIHIQPQRGAADGLTAALAHLHKLPDPPELLINGGDAIMDALATDRERTDVQWHHWRRVLAEHCPTRIEHCVGNHDVWGWDRAASGTTSEEPGWGKARCLEEFGLDRSYHSFEAGGWHFIVLDSIFPDDENTYIGQLDEEQWGWLGDELNRVPATTPIAVVSHIPLLSVAMIEFEQHYLERPRLRRSIVHSDARRIVERFRQHPNVKLCLSGHLHLVERIEYAGVTYLTTGAVSGNWWKGPHFHVAEGYGLLDLYNDGTFDTQYVVYGWQARGG